jgi:uncharacterized membrane protein
MQCSVCHNEVASPSAAFCNHCGAPLSAAAPDVPPAQPAYPPPPGVTSAGLSPNAAAAISYVTIIPAILFLILEPYNKMPLVRFHSFQSIGLAVLWFALWFVVMVLGMFVAFIPGVRTIFFVFPMLNFVVSILMFILWLVAIIKASQGEWFKLPIIGDFALKQAQS